MSGLVAADWCSGCVITGDLEMLVLVDRERWVLTLSPPELGMLVLVDLELCQINMSRAARGRGRSRSSGDGPALSLRQRRAADPLAKFLADPKDGHPLLSNI